MLSDVPQIVVRNQSHLDTKTAWNMAWAFGYQIKWQFGPIWKISADVTLLPSGTPVPSGAWIIDLLEESGEEGALGYHDEDGNEVPYGLVGVRTSEADRISPLEVLSHEGMELLADPHINCTAYDPSSGRLYAYEVGDPAQGGPYDLGQPYNKPIGLIMSDFVKPNWFDPNTKPGTPTSYNGSCAGAFDLGKGGYVSYTKKLPPNWQQQLGEHVNPALVDHDQRLKRRADAATAQAA